MTSQLIFRCRETLFRNLVWTVTVTLALGQPSIGHMIMGPDTRNRGAIILSNFFYRASTDRLNGQSEAALFPKVLVSFIFIDIMIYPQTTKTQIIIIIITEIEGIASFKENFSTDLIHWAGSTADHLAFFENNVYSTELLAWVSRFSYKTRSPAIFHIPLSSFCVSPLATNSIDFILNVSLLALITQPDIPGPSENYSGVVWSKIDSSKP